MENDGLGEVAKNKGVESPTSLASRSGESLCDVESASIM
jgi:hypothetical protein